MSSLPTTTTFNHNHDDAEKVNQTSISTRRARRRRFLIIFGCAFLIFVYLFSPYNATFGNPFSNLLSKLRSWTDCHSRNPMSEANTASAKGWHARATEHTGAFEPKKADLLLEVLINSQVEHDGFTLGLIKPNLAVDARGKVLSLSASDFAAFEAKIEEVKSVPKTSGFRGQWRVKQDRTSFPIDIIKIPGEDERSVYGWSASTTTLEAPTNGHTTLPEPLQTLVEWAKEARDGYRRGQADQTVVDKVKAL